jgi:prepilin peptidase CpaA
MVVFQWGVVIGASLLAAVTDLRERRIPNALTFPLFVAGLMWAAWQGGLTGAGEAFGAAILAALPFVLLFLFAGGGAGDAKLMGAIGAWLGLRQGMTALLCVAVAGGTLALVRAIAQKQLKLVLTSVYVAVCGFLASVAGGRTLRRQETLAEESQPEDLYIPYGVAIFAGVCIAAGVVWMWGVEWLW